MKKILWSIRTKILSLISCKTVGARALVISGDQILLVKHTYISKWHTVGGAVDKGETPVQAVQRELLEEVGITCLSPPKLISVYYNNFEKRDDYVILYIVKHFTQKNVISSEILESQWFPLLQLPFDTSAATQRRVEEFLGIRELSENW